MGTDSPTTNKHSNNFGFVLVAAAAGAIAGLLFAPKRGADTRKDLKIKYNETKNKSQDVAETAREKVSEGVESFKSKMNDAEDKSVETVHKAADKAKSAVDNAANTAKQATDHVAERGKHDHPAM